MTKRVVTTLWRYITAYPVLVCTAILITPPFPLSYGKCQNLHISTYRSADKQVISSIIFYGLMYFSRAKSYKYYYIKKNLKIKDRFLEVKLTFWVVPFDSLLPSCNKQKVFHLNSPNLGWNHLLCKQVFFQIYNYY